MLYFYLIGLAVLLIASFYDIRTREIPDTLSYSFIIILLVLRVLFSFQQGFSFLLEGLLGMAALGLFGLIMFFFGQWGGADAKLMFGLGLVVGLPFKWFNPVLIYLVCIIFAGAFYGLIYLAVMCVKHFSDFKFEFKKRFQALPFVLLLIMTVFSIIVLINVKEAFLISVLVTVAVLPLLYVLYISIKSIEIVAFRQVISVKKLVEGDWLAHDIIKNKKVVVKARKVGLLKSDIEKLKKLGIKEVKVKSGMPFVPVFLIALVFFLIVKYAGILPV